MPSPSTEIIAPEFVALCYSTSKTPLDVMVKYDKSVVIALGNRLQERG